LKIIVKINKIKAKIKATKLKKLFTINLKLRIMMVQNLKKIIQKIWMILISLYQIKIIIKIK
jgi:hypothetical protein